MISAYTGLMGSGKTLSMTIEAYRLWKQFKLPVYANYNLRFPLPRVRDKATKKLLPQEYYYPNILYGLDFLEAFKQVDEAIFLIDECGTVFDNRSWRTFPLWLMARFRESRKAKLQIMYTAQSISDVDVKLRQVTNIYIKCRFFSILNRFDLLCVAEKYHNPVIKQDSASMRKEWHAGTDAHFFWDFKKFYRFYNTYERIVYDFPEGKELKNLLKINKFQSGEYK